MKINILFKKLFRFSRVSGILFFFIMTFSLFANELKSRKEIDSMFPLSLHAELTKDNQSIIVHLENICKDILILDKTKFNLMVMDYYYYKPDGNYTFVLPSGPITSDGEIITSQCIANGIGKRFITVMPQKRVQVTLPLIDIFKECKKRSAQVTSEMPLEIQVNAFNIVVGMMKDNIPVMDENLLMTSFRSKFISIESIPEDK